jgi:3'-phosphoadenosine 5'-phosphosulfate sulfotransferase (PAPS reductase)/FAD synthetase
MSAPNPYRIEGPALISFSGGRTSGYMLWHILDAHDGKLPDDVHVCFANTGKEREETLRFVHECATRWGVRVRWLEFVTDLVSVGAAGRFEEVGYNSASRDGEPLSRLIERKQALFSTIKGRWCTERCKVGAMHDFMEASGFPRGSYIEVIGFRADEYDRVYELPRKPKNADRRLAFPLAEAGVRKGDVLRWWEAQPFDLELPRGTGNCDHCPFVSDKARIARARLNPEGLDWWERHERERGFSFGFMSIADLRRQIAQSPLLALDDIEADAADSECGAWCAGEAA